MHICIIRTPSKEALILPSSSSFAFISVLLHFLTCGRGSCWFYFLTCGLCFCWCPALMWHTEMTQANSVLCNVAKPTVWYSEHWTVENGFNYSVFKPFDWIFCIVNTEQWTISFDVIFIFKLLVDCVTLWTILNIVLKTFKPTNDIHFLLLSI